MCVDQGLQTETCNKCKNMCKQQCHGEEKSICTKCAMVGKTAREIKNHMQSEHNNNEKSERSREVCWHWRQGNCFRGNSCHFSHIGHQKSSTFTRTPTTTAESCRNGVNCQWKEKRQCRYVHQGVGVQKPHAVQGLQSGRQGAGGNQEAHHQSALCTAQGRKLCRWNQRCFRKESCKFAHTNARDFPQNTRSQPWSIVRNLDNGRNQRRN